MATEFCVVVYWSLDKLFSVGTAYIKNIIVHTIQNKNSASKSENDPWQMKSHPQKYPASVGNMSWIKFFAIVSYWKIQIQVKKKVSDVSNSVNSLVKT